LSGRASIHGWIGNTFRIFNRVAHPTRDRNGGWEEEEGERKRDERENDRTRVRDREEKAKRREINRERNGKRAEK